jgi:hypothetical protein
MTLPTIALCAALTCCFMLIRLTWRAARGELTEIPTPIAGLLLVCLTLGTIAGLTAWRML